jgi:hypothetical protein
MRIWILAYGLLYIAFETVGYQLEQVGWAELTSLDVATAITDACLVVALVAAAYVGGDLALQRWRQSMTEWHARQEPAGWPVPFTYGPIGVSSWRVEPEPEPLRLPAVRYSNYALRSDDEVGLR